RKYDLLVLSTSTLDVEMFPMRSQIMKIVQFLLDILMK
ncbi:hypothetical protein S1OALGB6SA_273, partial [Olavius algarvensis spirochete endosymbiont]